MSKHLPRWLNDSALCGMGGRYEGVVAQVVEERVRNRFKRDVHGKPIVASEPVIVFEDGWRLVPNIGMRKVMIDAFGLDSDGWIGRRLVIDRQLNDGTNKWEKRVQVQATREALDVVDSSPDVRRFSGRRR